MWSLEFSADAERDFELIFDHLVESYLEFGEDNDVAFERAVERIPPVSGKLSAALLFSIFQVGGIGH